MKTFSYKIATVGLILGMAVMQGEASGHGTEQHGTSMPETAQMKKLHHMMPMFALASGNLGKALESKNASVAEAEASKILAAIPELKKSKPHKNQKQHKTFVALATKQEKAVVATVDFVRKGDFAAAKGAYETMEKVCTECHVQFRD